MLHPLSTIATARHSLAPFGFVLPQYRERLDYQSPIDPKHINHERIVLYLWERANRVSQPGPLPITTIIHEIIPAADAAQRLIRGDSMWDDREYLKRDIALLSTIVQWFGTSVGRVFLEDIGHWAYVPSVQPLRGPDEYVQKLRSESNRALPFMWTHSTCNDRCHTTTTQYMYISAPHCYVSDDLSIRDRAVINGLMVWLGMEAGREFTRSFVEVKNKLWDRKIRQSRADFSAARKHGYGSSLVTANK